MDSKLRADWPVLMHYDPQHLACIAMPLGGIGTGTVSLGGRGQLRDWEIMNRPAKGYDGGEAVFALYAKAARQPAVTRALEGVLQPPYEGAHGTRAAYHGLPRFRKCAFHAAYPLAQVTLSDPDVPVDVRLEAFNPLVPADADASGWPVAILRYVLANKTGRTVSAAICGVLRNFIGADGAEGAPQSNRNSFRAGSRLRGLYMTSDGVDVASSAWGSMALATLAPAVTHLCAWPSEGWRDALLHFWDDFSQDGRLDPAEHPMGDAPKGALAAEVTLAPHAEGEITFILAWHFPNRQTWTPLKEGEGCSCGCGDGCSSPNTVGNYYATRLADAWDAAERCADQLEAFEAKTVRFVRALCEADLPNPVKEAALFNLSTLRSQTSLRTADGRFYGWEGCNDQTGCCHGSCTHVWNYEQATAFLFGDLSRSMRETEFLHATDERGHMSFRINLPLTQARSYGLAAADGQMGCIMKAYRDWQLGGDDAWLCGLWPQIKRALEFCWIPGGWDADQDGVMEGCQHNTLDVEYFGPNPLMEGWYLGALRAAEEMARHVGDGAFADRCRDLFTRGRDWVDANLFNGEYYEQRVSPPGDAKIAEGLRSTMGAQNLADPDYQVGPGCLVDQLAGQFLAHVCGLGYLLDPDHVRATLGSILKYNYQTDLYAHFNHMRTYALNDERALLICTYPRGGRPRTPVPYCNEVMTGFEYTAAVGMLYEGQVSEGLRCIASIRARYDGLRRNPFDEAECGHHYARAMASWAAVLALSGFHYSAPRQEMAFADAPGLHFWSTGYAWGTCEIEKRAKGADVALTVLHGALTLRRLTLTGYGAQALVAPRTIGEGESGMWRVEEE